MRQLDPAKLAKLNSTNQLLDSEYGKHGTPERDKFDSEALAWFYGNMLRERRRELNLTQKQLAEKLGREQSYIARVENGKVDLQLSSFFRIATILGIQFIPNYV
jgi:ribosome-binding protein aMBF1 (putative translation factor)